MSKEEESILISIGNEEICSLQQGVRVISLHKIKVKNIYPRSAPTQFNTKPKKEVMKEGRNEGRREGRKEGR